MLNMDNFKIANDLLDKRRTWNLEYIWSSVASVSVFIASGLPRNFSAVMEEFINKTKKLPDVRKVASVYLIDCTGNELVSVAKDILMGIKEFREWNLTDAQYLAGIDVDNRDTEEAFEYWKNGDRNFIDLDAFFQNLMLEIRGFLVEEYFFEGEVL